MHGQRTILRIRCVAAMAAAVMLCACVQGRIADGQEVAGEPLAGLQNGRLVIWVVEPAAPTPLSKALAIAALHNATPLTYQEHDAGTFGQTAGSYGTEASNYGKPADTASISAPPAGTGYHEQTSGSFGQTSGGYGTASSNYGQTASSLGQTASNYGVDSSNHGHDAGTYGNSLSTIAQAGSPPAANAQNLSAQQAEEMHGLEQRVSTTFPNLHVQYLSADPVELRAQLAAAQRAGKYPDLLMAPAPGSWWSGVQHEFGVAMLQPASFYPDGVTQAEPPQPRLAVLAHAPNMETARAFALWMSETGSSCDGCVLNNLAKNAQAPATVAISAVTRLLHGEALGAEADPEMAAFPPQSATALLASTASADTPLRVEVMQAAAHGRVAAVELRAIAASRAAFGVVHPLVVLRRDDDGRWRVLHVSLDLPPAEQQSERRTLMSSIEAAPQAAHTEPAGISQASPANGDTRPPQPVLWWDNRGGASLQVIEWQVDQSGQWTDPRLYLATDVGARLRTQVTARFADSPAVYRWRVWSVGAGGAMKISPWSTLKIVPQ